MIFYGLWIINYFNSLYKINLPYLYLSNSLFSLKIYYPSDFFLLICGVLLSDLSNIALFARLANWRVENVSNWADKEGLIQMMNLIFPWPNKESLKILVNFEFLKGIWVLDFYIKADIQCPKTDKLLLKLVNYWILVSF